MWAGDDTDDDEYDEDECGIGASFRVQQDGQVHCIGLLNGGPAEQSGVLQTGDILLKVDGIAVNGKTHSEVLGLIMGPADSLVELELQRDDALLTVEIRRDWTSNPMKTARAMGPQPSGEFDPSLYAGSSDSDEEAEEDTDQECGIGMSVGLDEMGLYRVTEVVLGGAADSTDDVRVGDILQGVGDVHVNTEMPHRHVMGLLRGPPKTTVVLHLQRNKQQWAVTVTRQRAEHRVWKVLSEYSTMHPEDFEDFTDDEDAGGADKQGARAKRASAAAGNSAERSDRAKTAVEDMKSKLLSQNEDIAILRARMEEAERGKEGLLQRINQLLARAQSTQPHSPPHRVSNSPDSDRGIPTSHPSPASSPQVSNNAPPPLAERLARAVGGAEGVGRGNGDAATPAAPVAAEKCGIGLRLAATSGAGGYYHVNGLEPGGPAVRSKKVHEGDVLLMVDGVSVRGMDVSTLSKHILGPVGVYILKTKRVVSMVALHKCT